MSSFPPIYLPTNVPVMVTVAIAGGTGSLGRHIARAILATKKYDVVILSRSSSSPELEALGARVAAVSYTDPASLDRALSGVHTVIAVIFDHDPATFIGAQVALIDAAVRQRVKRFAPSEFNVSRMHNDPIALYRPKAVVADYVRKSGLEYTFYEAGIHMNYLATGTEGLAGIAPINIVINVAEFKAQIPGDGNAKVAMTRVEDIGNFVAASLELGKWPEVSRFAGDVKSYNEVVALAEAARGMFYSSPSHIALS